MALPTSTLSAVCRSVADFVSEGLDAANLSIRVSVGNPAEVAPKEGDTEHRVNLFFYRVDPFGFAPDGASDEVGWLRLQCLITAFGVLEDQVSVGENDLRLLGEVIRLFHETPVLAPIAVNGESIQLQVVLQPLGADDINHLWSTQGDVAYRTSVAYEMAVMPVVPARPAVGSPLVGHVGYEARRSDTNRRRPFAGATFSLPAVPVAVETAAEGWAPHVCFAYQGMSAYSLAFEVGSENLDAFEPAVMVLGEPGAEVTLRWDEWTAEAGWATSGAELAATAAVRSLDPEHLDEVPTVAVPLPFVDHAGQAVLYAVRGYERASDGASLTVRSNPLLVTLYQVEP